MSFNSPEYEGVKEAVRLGMFSVDDEHPDNVAVDNLAAAMKAKLAKQRSRGYTGWDTDCTQERLSQLLREHVNKGDPVDVANFCAFLFYREEGVLNV